MTHHNYERPYKTGTKATDQNVFIPDMPVVESPADVEVTHVGPPPISGNRPLTCDQVRHSVHPWKAKGRRK